MDPSRLRRWGALTFALYGACIFALFSEWLFLVTKPSFFRSLDLAQSLGILFSSLLAPVAACSILLLPFLLADAALHWFNLHWFKWGRCRWGHFRLDRAVFAVALTIPAAILSLSLLLLLDNFTYTVFRVGIIKTPGLWSLAYLAILAVIAVWVYRRLGRFLNTPRPPGIRKYWAGAVAGVMMVSAGVAATQIVTEPIYWPAPVAGSGVTRPNILLVHGDAIEARRTSAYGYERETTPFLKRFMEEALVFENYFSNSSSTSGHTVSILTGKLPIETRVIKYPDILMGRNAYEHLPGMLRDLGYETHQISLRRYADAVDFNMRDAFDRANFRSGRPQGLLQHPVADHLLRKFNLSLLFLETVSDRIEVRLQHILQIKPAADPHALVTVKCCGGDRERVDGLLRVIDEARKPFFAQIHLLGTHGKIYSPARRVYSAGKEQERPWMRDFYDDAVLELDGHFRRIVEHLRQTGQHDRTLVIFSSDHGIFRRSNERLPLIIRFPGGTPAGRITANAQTIDIAPTILDYLGIGRPLWMRGRSLISGETGTARPIVGIQHKDERKKTIRDGRLYKGGPEELIPPFFNLKAVTLIVCDRFYRVTVPGQEFTASRVDDHTAPCAGPAAMSDREARAYLLDRLRDNGYPVTKGPDAGHDGRGP